MKTIIHIGQHKTGTTSIQNFLQENRKTLAKDGLYVPSSIAGYEDPSHFILNIYALDEERYSPKKEELIEKRGKYYLNDLEIELKHDIENIYKDALHNHCDKVLWTNEGLYLLNSITEYERLIGLFSEYSTEIEAVCCFRDVESYRDSYKKQLSKQKILFSNNPDSYRYLVEDSWLFDYERKKNLLSEVFDKCTYFTYDSNDNVKKFLETIGQNSFKTNNYRINVTMSTHNKLLQRIKKHFTFFYH